MQVRGDDGDGDGDDGDAGDSDDDGGGGTNDGADLVVIEEVVEVRAYGERRC